MTYDSDVLADSPWGYWKNDETAGNTLADSSGNAHPMTFPAGPTLAQPGPVEGMSSVLYPQGVLEAFARTDVTTGLLSSATQTIETWVYVPASATMGRTALVSTMSEATSSAVIALMVALETDGSIVVQNNAAQVDGPVLSRDTWYHVVGSVGAAGLKVRVDKVTAALNAAQTGTVASNYAVFQRREKNSTGSGSDWRARTQVRLGPTSIYATQLSDARTDAHYDAAFAPAVPPPPPTWWNDTAPQEAERLGWWNGSTVQSVTLLGQWTGSVVAAIEPLPLDTEPGGPSVFEPVFPPVF